MTTMQTITADQREKFERILDLEHTVRVMTAVRDFASDADRARASQSLAADRRRLYALVEALTPAELAAFGSYRAATTR